MKDLNKIKALKLSVSKGLLMILVVAICLKPAIKLCYTFMDKKVVLIENVAEEDSEEEKVDDTEEFEKFCNDQQSGEYSYIFSGQVSYFKLQQLTLEFFPAVVSPPPELS
ncbi:MAG: hypothetical protein ABJG68_13055 [Crocinitomicaceae bacterium]